MHVVVRDQIVRSKFDGANSYEQIAKLTTNDNNRTTTYHTRPPGGLLLNSRAQDDCPISTCLQDVFLLTLELLPYLGTVI